MTEFERLQNDVKGEMHNRRSLYANREGLMYLGLALAGEAGEVADQVKKWMRDDAYDWGPDLERQHQIKLELGDVLWYFIALCNKLGTSIEEIAFMNQDKLAKRREEKKNVG